VLTTALHRRKQAEESWTDRQLLHHTHSVQVKDTMKCTAPQQLSLAFQLMTVGLLNTGFQNLKYQDQIFRTYRSTFISHSSRNIRVQC